MDTRRTFLTSVGLGVASVAAARAADAVFVHLNDDSPKATVIKGTPTVLDFGDGLKIPCDKSAFLTLFEGKMFWLTLGAGRSDYPERAQGMAVLYALSAMKLLLMTLALAPDRMVQTDGGWRLKQQRMENYVLGDIKLPGKPYWPINDTQLFGANDMGTTNMPNVSDLGGGKGSGPSQGNGAQPQGAGAGLWAPSDLNKIDAYTSYIVMKRDADLAYVRANAQVLLR